MMDDVEAAYPGGRINRRLNRRNLQNHPYYPPQHQQVRYPPRYPVSPRYPPPYTTQHRYSYPPTYTTRRYYYPPSYPRPYNMTRPYYSPPPNYYGQYPPPQMPPQQQPAQETQPSKKHDTNPHENDFSLDQDPNSIPSSSSKSKEDPPVFAKSKETYDPSDTTIDNRIRSLSDNLYSFKGAPDGYNPADLLITPYPRPVNEAAMISPDSISYIPVLPVPPCNMKLFPDLTPSPFPYVPSEPSIYMPES